jgi:ABC-type multidrug transport system fused ATPase/permease subunit
MVRGMLWPFLVLGILLTCISGVLSLSGPLAVNRILQFLMNPKSTVNDQHTITVTVVAWIAVSVFRIFLNQMAERQFIFAAIRT